MTDDELMNPDNWEPIGDIRPPVEKPRALVTIEFTADEFHEIASTASFDGFTVTKWIRRLAVDASLLPRVRVHR